MDVNHNSPLAARPLSRRDVMSRRGGAKLPLLGWYSVRRMVWRNPLVVAAGHCIVNVAIESVLLHRVISAAF